MITFKEQFDKLMKAYLEDKIKPSNPCLCFVGNLLNNKCEWRAVREFDLVGVYNNREMYPNSYKAGLACISHESDDTYTPEEIEELENVFMHTLVNNSILSFGPYAEEAIYVGFEKALLKLKEIHESKGEIVENYVFQKRVLQDELV